MRNISIAITATVAMLAAIPSYAETRTNKHEAIGVGSGAIVGAFAGGPVGFIIGAAIGAKVGDTMHQKTERIDSLQGSLTASNDTVARLAEDIDTLSGEVEHLQSVAHPELVSLMQAGIAMDLLFRTDEDVLSDTTSDRLGQLAGTLAGMPDIHIQLDGFADERGDEAYNLALSERRVQYIREQFVAAGVAPDRINITAHGESVATDATLDSFALERRVSVTLFIDGTQAVAATPSL
ncbi:MAG: OmpA family protein [Woeseiaceae bacterium]|nr:OmpA family protein [Woeseiaceae bacterium]